MTFDPFGDFEARGYLRNLAQEKDPAIVRRLEHASFTTGIDDAFEALKKKKALTYSDVLSTHNIRSKQCIRGPGRIAPKQRLTLR